MLYKHPIERGFILFWRKPVGDLSISKNELRKRIVSTTNCSPAEADKRIKAVIENGGGSLQFFLDNDLFELTSKQIASFLKNVTFREYVYKLVSENEESGLEIYRQMKRAKSDYGFSYYRFIKYGLLNADEDRFKYLLDSKNRREKRLFEHLAAALDVSVDDAIKETNRIQEKFGLSPNSYYTKCLYGKTDEEIEEFLEEEKREKEAQIKKIAKITGWTKKEVADDINRCYAKFGINKGDYPMLRCYELDDDILSTYANIRDSSTLSRKYNNLRIVGRLAEKSQFNENYKDFIKRKFWINRDTTFEEFEAFAEGLDEAFCKPINGSLGRGASLIPLKDVDLHKLYDELMNGPRMLLEERMTQHHELNEFYDQSINTLRLFTLLDNDEFHAFASFMRFGANGSLVDNVAQGGVGCGVDVETGTICTPAMDHDGNFIEAHPNSHKKFEGFKIPHWDKALELAEQALRKDPNFNYIGWDIVIREDDVAIIEGNSKPDLGICQAFFNYSKKGLKPQYEQFMN